MGTAKSSWTAAYIPFKSQAKFPHSFALFSPGLFQAPISFSKECDSTPETKSEKKDLYFPVECWCKRVLTLTLAMRRASSEFQ